MSKLKFGILAIVAMVYILASTVWADDLCAFEIYYTPLEMEFYVPPTPEDLEEGRDKYVVYNGAICEIYTAIIDKPSNVPVGYSFLRIRVKIRSINSGKVFYFTADKEVVDEDYLYGVDEQLFSEALKQIKTGHLNKPVKPYPTAH